MSKKLITAAHSCVHRAALIYASVGMSVLACKRDKTPALTNWKHLQERRATSETIDLWQRTGLLENVGIICGEVSGGLIIVDCDGKDAISKFASTFPELSDTYAVLSGSGEGAHYYLYANIVPPTTRVTGMDYGNIELRSNGAYVIAPPSIHPSGRSYTVLKPRPIKVMNYLNDLRYWIECEIKSKHHGQMPPAANRREIIHATKYASVALESECDNVRLAPVGSRNGTLNRAGFKLGRLVREGKIDRYTVETALYNAASAHRAQDGDAAIMRTIRAAIDSGYAKCGV